MRRIGHQLEISVVLVGNTMDALAVQLITNTALGKGKHLPVDLGYLDTRDPRFTVVRPLKEVSAKEVAMFLKLSGVAFLPAECLDSTDQTTERKGSVYQVTKKFVEDLQQGFSQTVSTLCKTGDKLCATTTAEKSNAKGKLCAFCGVSWKSNFGPSEVDAS